MRSWSSFGFADPNLCCKLTKLFRRNSKQQSGSMAQLVAHLHGMQGVRGSNPLGSTKYEIVPTLSGLFFCIRRVKVVNEKEIPRGGYRNVGWAAILR